jgi:hypothetical protein
MIFHYQKHTVLNYSLVYSYLSFSVEFSFLEVSSAIV